MNDFRKFFPATTTSLVTCLLLAGWGTAGVRALPIKEYDRLSINDRGEFISLLFDGTMVALADEGKLDMARKMETLFLKVETGEHFPKGFTEFYKNLAEARRVDIANGDNGKRIHVEHALVKTMRDYNIDIPKNMTTITKEFRPSK